MFLRHGKSLVTLLNSHDRFYLVTTFQLQPKILRRFSFFSSLGSRRLQVRPGRQGAREAGPRGEGDPVIDRPGGLGQVLGRPPRHGGRLQGRGEEHPHAVRRQRGKVGARQGSVQMLGFVCGRIWSRNFGSKLNSVESQPFSGNNG